ncbi:MAG: PAS domain S-box protein [Melioribacteraceae bacterium]|nr:PAS domain S-box protein [Melioribacteraceae bacterium]
MNSLDNNLSKIKILIVEDDEGLSRLIQKTLKRLNYTVQLSTDVSFIKSFIKHNDNVLLILDYNLPGITGKELIKILQKEKDDITFIVITGYGDVSIAVEMMKLGARDYLIKDTNFIEIMPAVIEKAVNELNRKIKLEAAEEALQERVEEIAIFRSFADTSGQGFCLSELNGIITYVNPALCKLLGVKSEKDLINKRLLNFYPKDERELIIKKIINTVIETGKWMGEISVNPRSGGVIPCQQNVFLIKDENEEPIYLANLITDITEKKQTEEFLNLQSAALEAAANAIVISNIRGDIVWNNSAFTKLTGYERKEIMYKNMSILHSNKHNKLFYDNLWETILSGKVWYGEIINQKKNGDVYIEEQTITPVFNKEDKITYFVSVKQDISERKKAEEQIKKMNEELEKRVDERTKEILEMHKVVHDSEEKFRTLFEANSDAIMLLSDEGVYDCNVAAVKVFRCRTQDDLLGNKIAKFSPVRQPDNQNSMELFERYKKIALEKGSAKFEWVHCYFDRTPFYAEVWLTEMILGGKIVIEAVVRDITEKKEAEMELRLAQSQLLQTEKMAALGELVAGVAHEINTPIGIAVTAASHLEEKTNELKELFELDKLKKSSLDDYIKMASSVSDSILPNLGRAANLISSFKQVAVDQTSEELRVFKLREYVDNILLSLRPKLKKTKHEINIDCSESLEIKSYPGALSHIINNLIINSLVHGFEEIEKGKISMQFSHLGNELMFVYTDDGKGIGEVNLQKIFEPFYTTKRDKGGSGLGLHILSDIVRDKLKGDVEVESEINKGVKFIIRFRTEKLND